jgi:hypothetical protein
VNGPLVWQVVPLSRPDCVESVVSGFARQLYSDRKLCAVINGPHAQDVEQALAGRADLVLRSATGKPAALNEAFARLRNRLIAVRDDDDVQLPGDLAECVQAMQTTGAEIVSRHKHWVWHQSSDTLWLTGEHLQHKWGDERVSGGSLLFRCRTDTPDVPNERVGECVLWARAMLASGCRVWRPSINHQIFVRGRGDHLFEADEDLSVAVYARAPKARRYGAPGPEHQKLCRGEIKPTALPHEIVSVKGPHELVK